MNPLGDLRVHHPHCVGGYLRIAHREDLVGSIDIDPADQCELSSLVR